MRISAYKHRLAGMTRMQTGASTAGALSLLLLPKCPLCLVPLLAALGLAIPATVGLWVASGILVAVWLTILLLATRTHPRIRAIAFVAAAVSVAAIGFQVRALLWLGVLAMTAAGFALSRICARCRHPLTDASRQA